MTILIYNYGNRAETYYVCSCGHQFSTVTHTPIPSFECEQIGGFEYELEQLINEVENDGKAD